MTSVDIQSFLNTAAHDLKSPLRRIVSYCAMLREDASPRLKPEEVTMLGRIETNTVRLQDLVENLMYITRLYTNPISPESTDVENLINECIMGTPTIENETRIIDIQPLPRLKIHPRELKTLLTHLIKNAQLYADPNRPLQLKINASVFNGDVVISVIDNGMGIAPNYQHDVMEPFKRLHTQDDIEGSGLGLYICEQIINRINGSITLESNPEIGTIFTIKIPVN